MRISRSFRRHGAVATVAIVLSLVLVRRLGSAQPPAPRPADLNPAMVTYLHPDQIKWTGNPSVAQQAVLMGDPTKPGMYIVLVKWYPHNFSHPHTHPNDRYAMVLSGTWWVGSGTKFDPDATVPMPAGSYVVDLAKQPHFDGAKDEAAIIEIVGEGPATMTPAEEK